MLRCQYAILAEQARPGLENTFDIFGIFDRLWVGGAFPAGHRQLSVVFLVVTDSEDDLGKHTFCLRFMAPGGQRLSEQRSEFVLKPDGGTFLGSTRLLFNFQMVVFPRSGKYDFVLDIDGRVIANHPLTVIQKPGK